MHKNLLLAGITLAGLSVALGAFGAHALKPILESMGTKETFHTAVQYHMFHAIAIMLTAILKAHNHHKYVNAAGFSFVTGIFLFSGSLYFYSITTIHFLVYFTPIGGMFFLIGWLLLGVAIKKNN